MKWKECEITYLIDNKDIYSLKELSLALGRSKTAISNKLCRYNLRKKRFYNPTHKKNFTKEEIEDLYREINSSIEIGKLLNCCHRTVLNYMNKFGIKPNNNKSNKFVAWNKGKTGVYSSDTISKMHSEINTKKRLSAALKSPNKKEIILYDIIKSISNDYKYCGNGTFIIGRYNPDFIDIKNKRIIELFGDYWHTKEGIKYSQTEDGRKDIFSKYGFSTLIVWEKELSNMILLKNKIKDFIGDKHILLFDRIKE